MKIVNIDNSLKKPNYNKPMRKKNSRAWGNGVGWSMTFRCREERYKTA